MSRSAVRPSGVPGGLTYAIGDLHGRFDLLEAALEAIDAEGKPDATTILLGDYVGRGGRSREVLERLTALSASRDRFVCLKGNHEEMMVAALRGGMPMHRWRAKGGDSILASYGAGRWGGRHRASVPAEHLDWLDALPRLHVDRHRVFVHAGVDPSRPLERQLDKVLLWKRYRHDDERGHEGRHVVHGHRPFSDGPVLLSGRCDLDTLAWKTGRLVVAVFEATREGGPVRLIEIGRTHGEVRRRKAESGAWGWRRWMGRMLGQEKPQARNLPLGALAELRPED